MTVINILSLLQDILYQIPVLLSGIIAEQLRTDCN